MTQHSDLKALQKRLLYLFYTNGESMYWLNPNANRVTKHDEAGWIGGGGYRVVEFDQVNMSVHRAVFLIHHGYLPNVIDHIDCNTLNNNISNLRECSVYENCHNRSINKNSTSGVKGVSWHKASNKWRARVQTKLTRVELGGFDSLVDAEKAIKLFRAKSHKEFARDR